MLEKTMADVKVTFLTKPARKMLVFHREGTENYHGLCGMEDAEAALDLIRHTTLSRSASLGEGELKVIKCGLLLVMPPVIKEA